MDKQTSQETIMKEAAQYLSMHILPSLELVGVATMALLS